ncbi:MAG: bifunctional riboflavin kinase/FAD synthetase [Acidimicrobiaceae bacterium]|nr:bifunctional riboflavin kinase/FAD synthetase [Acidimicrobiaceae bacterium]MCY4176461.1 bifunctional riboflavin kinase/FAD synthetase [Acidimicrobiaceae bacterium]MCY4280279.1 bifunctional riboflavin kinase/FAD synthetase [Acidimicrobiaceae bacterium]
MHDQRDQLPPGVSAAAAIGVFDGVHLGHQEVLKQVRDTAERLGAASAVVTFDTHPAHVVRPQNAPKLLTTLEQKLELLEAQRLDYVYVIEFDEVRAGTRPEEFVEQVFLDALHARAVVVGEDFHFGKGRAGNVAELQRLGSEWGFEVVPLELIRHRREALEPVSSTAVRRALAGGDVAGAAEMLGRCYEVRGTVVEGDKRGTAVGFPTANVPVPKAMAWPADAVYAGWCMLPDGRRNACAINIGRRPTFYEHAQQSLLEAHLLDFSDDLYGCEMRVEFVDFLRSERKFEGIEQLSAQLAVDVENAAQRLGLR